MFRNGITAGRRQLGKSSSSITPPPPSPPTPPSVYHNDLLFVCKSCRARGMATKAKTKPAPKKETMLSQLNRLEAHVHAMQKAYTDKVKKHEALKSVPEGDITDEMKDTAYEALMAPEMEMPTAGFLPPLETLMDRLTVPMQQRLQGGGISLALVTAESPQWAAVLDQLDLNNEGLVGLVASDINSMIQGMSMDQRAELAPKIFELMKDGGVEPNSRTYDLFMMAHAHLENAREVKDLFAQIEERGIKPTVYSFGHLLKAYSQEADVANAAAAFQDMQALGIQPNLVVYSTLIQTCINAKDYATAWQIFNVTQYKSTATTPNVTTYTMMLHVCAQEREAERALDLWTDMTVRRGIKPTQETYHALIHACAVRKDYFTQAWKYATDMTLAGMGLDKVTLNILIQACGRVGELTRARLLVRHMYASQNPALEPDQFTYQNLLRAYATYRPPSNIGQSKKDKYLHPSASPMEERDAAAFLHPTTTLRSSGDHDDDAPPDLPYLDRAVLQTPREVLDESALLVNWLRDHYPHLVDTQLINAYLDICLVQSNFMDFEWSYTNDLYQPGLGQQSDPAIPLIDLEPYPRTIYTYRASLQAAVQFKNIRFARRVWADREAYKKTEIYEAEIRGLGPGAEEKLDFEAERCMVDVLALNGMLGEAKDIVLNGKFRGKWSWKQLRTLYVKAVQLEDPETVLAVKQATGEGREKGKLSGREKWKRL